MICYNIHTFVVQISDKYTYPDMEVLCLDFINIYKPLMNNCHKHSVPQYPEGRSHDVS
jgi:hypothetical protein